MDFHAINNIQFEGIDHRDHPDYSDAFISSAYIGSMPATESELEEINDARDFVYEKLMEHIF